MAEEEDMVGTRNSELKHNNSSPGKADYPNMARKESHTYYLQRDKSVDRYREQFYENKFHNRTNSVHQQPLTDRFKFQHERG